MLHLVKDSQLSGGGGKAHDGLSDLQVAESIAKSIHRIYILKHHPRSVQFLDFFVSKFLWLLLSWLLLGVYYAIIFSSLWPHMALHQRLEGHLSTVLQVANSVIAASTVAWWGWTIQGLLRSGLILRVTRYMTSRLRQVSFRAVYFQVSLCFFECSSFIDSLD